MGVNTSHTTCNSGLNIKAPQYCRLSIPFAKVQYCGKLFHAMTSSWMSYIDSLVQDCSNSSALAMELLQSCANPEMCLKPNHLPNIAWFRVHFHVSSFWLHAWSIDGGDAYMGQRTESSAVYEMACCPVVGWVWSHCSSDTERQTSICCCRYFCFCLFCFSEIELLFDRSRTICRISMRINRWGLLQNILLKCVYCRKRVR